MGKREVGQLGIIDLIVSILIAELAAISIENYDNNIFFSIIPILTLLLLQVTLAMLSLRKPKFRILMFLTIQLSRIFSLNFYTKLMFPIQ